MIVTCRFNKSSDLADHQRHRGESSETVYDVTVGARYIVLGMMIWENVLDFLIRDDSGNAGFYQAGLFECQNQRLPQDWLFSVGLAPRASGRDLWSQPLGAIWGYEELVRNPDHAAAIQEGDEAALLLFFAELICREKDLAARGEEL